MWAVLLALAASVATGDGLSGDYRAVTETEYAIELRLEPSGRARLDFSGWEADGAAPAWKESHVGSWSSAGEQVELRLQSGRSARFKATRCLAHSEFGGAGCSPGLRLMETTFPDRYGLKRFGLWRSDGD